MFDGISDKELQCVHAALSNIHKPFPVAPDAMGPFMMVTNKAGAELRARSLAAKLAREAAVLEAANQVPTEDDPPLAH